jgi:hypothetical protein
VHGKHNFLTLIDILESPKPEADKKLEELEASLAEMFTEKEKQQEFPCKLFRTLSG